MRITANYNQPVNQTSFGNFIAGEQTIAYLNRAISPKKADAANKIIAGQTGKKPNLHLHLGYLKKVTTGHPIPFLRAKIGDEVFEEGLCTSAFGVLKNAAKYVDALSAKPKA